MKIEYNSVKLTIWETKQVRGDQIKVFKITHRIGLDSGMFFKYMHTRGHIWALAKAQCKIN